MITEPSKRPDTESRKCEGGVQLRGKKIQISVPSGDGDRDAEFAVGAALVAEHQRKRVSVLAARFHETVRWAQDGILSREENNQKIVAKPGREYMRLEK